MNAKDDPIEKARLERVLALLLRYGTSLASAVIGLGILRETFHPQAALTGPGTFSGLGLIKAGIALLIALPILRLLLMLLFFVRQRDYAFGLISFFVLLIIAIGFLLGVRHS